MTAIPHTITINSSQEEWLNSNPEVSLSKIAQNSINEHIEMTKISAETLKEANRKIENWRKIAVEARNFIEKKGLINEWLEEQGS